MFEQQIYMLRQLHKDSHQIVHLDAVFEFWQAVTYKGWGWDGGNRHPHACGVLAIGSGSEVNYGELLTVGNKAGQTGNQHKTNNTS